MRIKQMKNILLGAALTVCLAGAGQAATVAFSALPGVAIANPSPTASTPIFYDNIVGSVVQTPVSLPGDARSVWDSLGSTVSVATGVYSAVTRGSSATFDFVGTQNILSFVWGSVDKFNTLSFYLGGGLVDTFNFTSFAQMQAAGFVGGRSAGRDSMSALITNIGALGRFDRVVFTATEDSFEFANLKASVVPLPAGGFLLLGGIAALVGAKRRRKLA